ncbi:MAG TPA: tetratricopeptide repeat protein [Polaromonas sp.]|uniref:tetratricopeptide repeat protein n=1 Tax=Polaromonas sp. TaxID=1869339 RepID=UPI002D68FEEF|nr:tetratricopeptide repeat protein [Polaromonas sp.]HYW56531.1 tetratricopeptide repeat protein [Polaromonas sp.]
MFTKLRELLVSGSPKTAPEITVKKRGDKHLNLNELDEAAACYTQAISINPEFVAAYVGLGFALAGQLLYEEAATALNRALSIDPAIADAHYILGTISRARNDRAGTIRHFTRALELKPDLEFAYRDFFDFLLQSGQSEEAKALIQRGLLVFPESAEFHFFLGNLLFNQQDFEGAISCHTQAVSLQPTAAISHKILGDAHRNLNHNQTSAECYEAAALLEPSNAEAHVNLGDALDMLGNTQRSIACYRRAIALEPGHLAAHRLLGNVMLKNGDKAGAVACYRKVVELQPDSPVVHLVAALSGESTDSAPRGYVEQLFDEYAQHYDSHLSQTLNYTLPEKLAEMVGEFFVLGPRKWSVLDLGCGTGLTGSTLAAYAGELVGVDLSSKMLSRARARNIYSRLVHMDMASMMKNEAPASYDLLVSADVFLYVGELAGLFDQAKRLLRHGGLFAFSVESLDALNDVGSLAARADPGYKLTPTGRYAHSMAYLSRMATHHGFEILSTMNIQCRLEQGKEVPGRLTLLRRLVNTGPH